MIDNTGVGVVRAHGETPFIGHAVITSTGNTGLQTLTEAFGIASVNCTGVGLYTVQLSDAFPNFAAHYTIQDPTAANYHKVVPLTKVAGQQTIAHQSNSSGTLANIPAGLELHITYSARQV